MFLFSNSNLRSTRFVFQSSSVEGMEPQIREEERLNRSRIEAGEGSPTFGDEILPPDVLHPAAASTPLLQSLSGSKRKRTPRPTSMPEVERAGQTIADDEAEEDVGDRHVNEDLSAGLDGEMGDGWSEQGYGGEDSDEFDRGYTVEGQATYD